MNNLLFLVLGLALPILLWPIEYLLPFPHIVEELAKFCSLWVLRVKFPTNKFQVKLVLLFAFLFTLSETVLYTMNFFILGQLYLFPKRLFLTGVLHISTILILFFGLKRNKKWQLLALLTTIFLHYFYNNFIAILF